MTKYNPTLIEKKWQDYWEEEKLFQAEDFSKKPKYYILIEFPYPSGAGLHVGHCRSFSALDAIARKRRMQGYNVLFPIGWDAFGLPAENFALKTGVHPEVTTEKNIANFKRQLKSLGLSFDWSREIKTTDPSYYKWTQWIFLQLFKKGLAYEADIPINWCPKCKIGLANEEVVNGRHERCGEKVIQKKVKQWVIKITKYAHRLIKDLETVDYLEKIKKQQINWIGESPGTEVIFPLARGEGGVKVFTTRVDTIFGVSALVIAPEHELIEKLKDKIENRKEVSAYIEKASQKTEFERKELEKERDGVPLKGIFASHPLTGEKIPLWVADYVVGTYGEGAIMLVPAHDKRDYAFAKKYNLPMKEVIAGGNIQKEAFTDYGRLINSGQFSGLSSKEAIEKITNWLGEHHLGKKATHYKLRDWIFSRQHYWGEPIPLVHCPKCGVVPVPEKDLPVKLPYVKKYQPTGTGESPLASIKEWVNTTCPKCGGPAKRETDTMPNWAGSNWYFMRYCDPHNNQALADKGKLKYWLPVDWYNGGMEHTTLHLLYSRFIYKFLYDIGIAPTPEPYKKRTSHGMVLAADGRKMSKSLGNVVNPDDIVKKYGADTLRVYEMFMGPFDQAISWSDEGVKGVYRFLEKLWQVVLESKDNPKSSFPVKAAIHRLNKKVDEDLEKMKFNTAIAAFMKFLNFVSGRKDEFGRPEIERLLLLLTPFAPHISEELWHQLGKKDSIHREKWPHYDKKLLAREMIDLIVQVDGRVRSKIKAPSNLSQKKAEELVFQDEKVKKWLQGKEIRKVIFLQGKLINIVTH